MTGHDDRRIVSSSADMMTDRTGFADIMSIWSDLGKQLHSAALDMMTGSVPPVIVDHRDLRKRATDRFSAEQLDMMSGSHSNLTARSGRRSP